MLENSHKHLPIVIIGAGGIVRDAHLPAYQIAGFKIAGIFDIDPGKSRNAALQFSINKVYDSLEQLIEEAPHDAVFDIALPPEAIIPVLLKIPENRAVLIQKPMGSNFRQATDILRIARERKLIAGINFQLRYAPFITEARSIIEQGLIGDVCDFEVNVNVNTPWETWDFLANVDRVEILYHSIHYIDLVRSFYGNPTGIFARTFRHPSSPGFGAVRSSIIMDYGEWKRAVINTNHNHNFSPKHQHAQIRIEGTNGAILINMGLLLDYPKGGTDSFEWITRGGEWQSKKIQGTWFPHAFIGSMNEVMLAAADEFYTADNSVEDCIHTMGCVEAAYMSSGSGSTPLP